MPKPKKKTLPLSRRRHVVLTCACLFFGGLVAGCVALAYVFIAYPAFQAARQTVAGEFTEQWLAPVRQAEAQPAPTVAAPAGAIVDVATGDVLWQRDVTTPRPLASLTKLVTASAYVATAPNVDKLFTVPADFHTAGITEVVEPGTGVSRLEVTPGERLTYKDLLFSALVGSANNAALALAKAAGLTADDLQRYAVRQGAVTTRIVEPSGLDPANVGSVQDVLVLAHAAFRQDLLRTAAGLPAYRVTTQAGRAFSVRSTDQLIGRDGYTVVAGKTGFLVDAGYNLVVQAQRDGHAVLLVLLGAPTSDDRFADADALLRWAFGAFTWQTVRGGAMLPL